MNVSLLIDGNTICVSNSPPHRQGIDLKNQAIDPASLRALRQMLAAEIGHAARHYSDRKVIEEVAKRLATNRWSQVLSDPPQLVGNSGNASTAQAVAPPPPARGTSSSNSASSKDGTSGTGGKGTAATPAKEPDLTWIEIQIVDEDGQPLLDETYEFSKTDGAVAKGATSGAALRGDQIPPGKCKLKLPDLHKNGWTGHGKAR